MRLGNWCSNWAWFLSFRPSPTGSIPGAMTGRSIANATRSNASSEGSKATVASSPASRNWTASSLPSCASHSSSKLSDSVNTPKFKERKPHLTFHRLTVRWSAGLWQAREAIFLMFAVLQLSQCAVARDNGKATGSIEGAVFVEDQGHQSYAAGARVLASGPVKIEAETNADGKYVFAALPPGTYTVAVTFSGLEALRKITVEANQVVQVQLQLRPPQVKTSVTVTADSTDAKAS